MTCKSCKNITEGKFCSNCGQKTNTHRLNAKHFFEHDIIHGVFHLDKGLLFTIKEILKNPSGVAKNYIEGNRKPYYNFFYILLLIAGLFIVLTSQLEETFNKIEIREKETFLTQLKFIKIYLFAYIPFYALSSWLLLPKLQYNYLEHCILAVVATISLCIANFLGLGSMALMSLFDAEWNIAFSIINAIASLLMIAYPIWTYYNISKNYYNKITLLLRIALIIIIAQVLIALLIKLLTLATA